MTNYNDTEKFLKSEDKFRIKLGLENVERVLELLGNPQERLKIVHVAGTNGKGSVCATAANIFTCAGLKTALYTSPHLFKYTERMKIDGVPISDEVFSANIRQIEAIARENGVELTEFELLTTCAFKYFADEKVDVAVIETGLGGRFDATNVVKKPLMTVITSISIDHKDRLGDTVEKIAFEKAGIIKPGVLTIIGAKNAGLAVVRRVADEKNAYVRVVEPRAKIFYENGKNFVETERGRLEFGLLGLYQAENVDIVGEIVRATNETTDFKVSDEDFARGLKTVKWSARMQYLRDKNTLVDGAHNVAGAKKLVESLKYYFPNRRITWVYGSLNTKEYEKTTKILFGAGENIEDSRSCGNFDEFCADDEIDNSSNFKLHAGCVGDKPDGGSADEGCSTVENVAGLKTSEILLYQFGHPGSMPAAELLKLVKSDRARIATIGEIQKVVNDPEKFVVVTGSFYMLSEIFAENDLL
ncbi:MAG: bifunctional folylpolyglutamate synthase/dihydrofolate synthase [Candidatus Gastranaerophilaceae bacterium]